MFGVNQDKWMSIVSLRSSQLKHLSFVVEVGTFTFKQPLIYCSLQNLSSNVRVKCLFLIVSKFLQMYENASCICF